MHYPTATPEQIRQFEADGFLVVEDAMDAQDLSALIATSQEIIRRRHELARDWDWRRGEDLRQRVFRIVQCGVTANYPWVAESRFRKWAAGFSASLMGQEMEFWYDQFLGKPPGMGAPTPWHQDEAYWGRRVWNTGITCWMSFHDVGPENGCMHFARGGHRTLLEHRNPPEMASDLLVCEAPEHAEIAVCRMKAGSVTFHHSKTPHMTTGNTSDAWRLTLAQHFWNPACKTMPAQNYHWRVEVNQANNERLHVANGVVERV
ncbi:MAG: phytanoyl-CoA dioxygenase family protein [Planctomycetes bacterium]|nr:phytanoyl-CoA dioxygenase family protein [Planctomycetota bacterium]